MEIQSGIQNCLLYCVRACACSPKLRVAIKLALYIIILLVSTLNQFQINVIAISEYFTYVTCYGKLAIFHENRILGIGRRRLYCRVQRSNSQALKSFLSRVMAKKLYTGHPCLSSQFFKKRSVLYVHSSTFNVSVYAPYYTTRLAP